MTHGHEVLHMMEGNSYSKESLIRTIKERFGAAERYYTCSQEGLTAETLVERLREKANSCQKTAVSHWM